MSKAKKKHRPKKTVSFYDQHYATKEKRLRTRLLNHIRIEKPRYWWRERKLWQKILLILAVFITLCVGTMYGIARWYMARHAGQPLRLGATFIPSYAEGFGLDPQETMQAMIDDLHIRHFRLVSYWEDVEPTPGEYDFSKLDWQFAKAEQAGAKVSLSIGLRQPRWPECHAPKWANIHNAPESEWSPKLKEVIKRVVERYRNSSALDSYQLENEFFLKAFGECTNFNRDRLVDEYNLVKQLDPHHTLIITRSNNALGLPVGEPTPDQFGVSVYKRVWDKTITKRYFEYPFPAWFYGFLAGSGEILTGKDMIIHELQAEPWPPSGSIVNSSSQELAKSLDAKRLADRFEYGMATGIRTVDLWGAEYWYYMKVMRGDSSLWNVAKEKFNSEAISNR